MPVPEENATDVSERRSDTRQHADAEIRVEVSTDKFGGRAENLSQAGVFFFSGDKMRVQVEFEEEGKVQTRTGHLVRVERLSQDTIGYAIEFERS